MHSTLSSRSRGAIARLLPAIAAMALLLLVATDRLSALPCQTQPSDSGLREASERKALDPADFSAVQTLLDGWVADGTTPAAFAAVGGPDLEPLLLAAGVRKFGEQQPVTTGDLVHIGSCTKAFTAVMIARLVDRGELAWTDSLAGRLPSLAEQADPVFQAVTLEQLLSHTAGLPANADNWWLENRKELKVARRKILEKMLQRDAGNPVGEFLYSNLGYVLAAEMAVVSSGKTWEELLEQEVLQPLGITTAGFGPPGKLKSSEQPWGHVAKPDGGFLPLFQDNAPAMGAAGRLHLTLADWLRFCEVFAGGGPPGFLSPASLEKLQTPVSDSYALGWIVLDRPWGNGTVLSHNGSNTMWMACCWIGPRTGRIYLAVVNHGSEESTAQTDRLIGTLIECEREADR